MAIDTMGAALRQIYHLFADGVVADLSDAQLLDGFLSQKDGGAFEVLVGRHRPMVLSVCRGVLRDPREAEDAFQATFLVLIKKGGSIRTGDSLGGWLYQVAHRVSIQANGAAARRRRLERKVGQMAVVALANGQAAWDDLLPALHEEIARLPEKYRLAIVLCDLEGMTQAQAAGQLHWSERTIRTRLAEGRARLKRRLSRRGLCPDVASLGTVFLREAGTMVTAAWQEATVKAALSDLKKAAAVGAVSTAAQSLTREVAKSMMIQQIMLVSDALITLAAIVWVAAAVFASRGEGLLKVRAQAADTQGHSPAHKVGLEPDPLDAVGTLPVAGLVLDPEGNPVAGAIIYVYHLNMTRGDSGEAGRQAQAGRVAVTAADGRFQFQLDKRSSWWLTYDQPAWHSARIVSVAPGFGPAWVIAGKLPAGGEVTLRLVRDDVPIDGRILDLEGRPVPGATVRLVDIDTPLQEDLTPWIKAIETLEADIDSRSAFFNSWLEVEATGLKSTRSTGADGRLRLTGIGRERVAKLRIEGPTIETQEVFVMTRVHHQLRMPFGKGMAGQQERTSYTCYGATFDHVALPTRLIVGVVRDQESGQALPGVKIESCRFANFDVFNHNIVQTVTDAEGKYRLVGMPPGRGNIIRLTPRADQPYLPALKEVDDRVGLEPVTADVALKRGIWIKGSVTDQASGRPVRGLVHYYARAANPHLAQVSGFKEAEAWTRKAVAMRNQQSSWLGRIGILTNRCLRWRSLPSCGMSRLSVADDRCPFDCRRENELL